VPEAAAEACSRPTETAADALQREIAALARGGVWAKSSSGGADSLPELLETEGPVGGALTAFGMLSWAVKITASLRGAAAGLLAKRRATAARRDPVGPRRVRRARATPLPVPPRRRAPR